MKSLQTSKSPHMQAVAQLEEIATRQIFSNRRLTQCVCLWLGLLLAGQARAGIGPENVVVVVNSASEDSHTIANHYAELRHIPSSNVIFLDDVPTDMVTNLNDFRERILKPLLEEIDKRQLSNHVRAIAYSAGFPYAVRVNEHHQRLPDGDLKKAFTPVASINGLTYLFRFVLADKENYLNPVANFYARRAWDAQFLNPFSGEEGEQFEAAGQAFKDSEYLDSALKYEALLEAHPTQTPLAILAARAHAKAGQLDEAMADLLRAEQGLWASGRWLAEDEALTTLNDRQDFKDLTERMGDAPAISQRAIAFDASRGWTQNGWWNRADQGVSYLPAVMLAVTRGKGTSVEEAITYLKRSSEADNTFPDSTVYLTRTADIRTKTRFPNFADSMLYLKWLGRKVEVVRTSLPEKANDVIGVTFGAATHNWAATGSTFVPGAIADNLTSTSGVMSGGGQTKLTELLKQGAAIASGTVTEPYALQFKFPLPTIHAYYAEGLSAIEAYYLSLESPYQLLIVGDPICQPFAKQPSELISGGLGKAEGADALILQTKLLETPLPAEQTSPLSELEIYVDGRLVLRTEPLDAYRLKLDGLPGGSYELRVVLIGEPRTAPRKTISTWFEAPGLLTTPVVEPATTETTGADGVPKPIYRLSATGADSMRILHYETEVARVEGDSGEVELDLSKFGRGPIRLRPFASFRGTEIPGKSFIVER